MACSKVEVKVNEGGHGGAAIPATSHAPPPQHLPHLILPPAQSGSTMDRRAAMAMHKRRRSSIHADLMRAMNMHRRSSRSSPGISIRNIDSNIDSNDEQSQSQPQPQRHASELILALSRRNLALLHSSQRQHRRTQSTPRLGAGGNSGDSYYSYSSTLRPSHGIHGIPCQPVDDDGDLLAAAATAPAETTTMATMTTMAPCPQPTIARGDISEEGGAGSHTVIARVWPAVSKKLLLLASLLLYVSIGWITFTFYPNNTLSAIDGYFEAITIGWSVGLSPRDTTYQPNPWFATWHILSGAALIAVLLTQLGKEVEEDASMNLSMALQRHEDYERKMRKEENPLRVRIYVFLSYNAAYLLAIVAWIVCMILIVIWSMYATRNLDDVTQRWGIDRAIYFAMSVCSSAGSMSLPPHAPEWSYLAAGLSMMIGVPLMALAVSCVVIMIWQNQRFRHVQDAAWEPITSIEMEAMVTLELVQKNRRDERTQGEDCHNNYKTNMPCMTKGEFVLLGLLRMGQDGGIIGYLSDAYDVRETWGAVGEGGGHEEEQVVG